MGSGRKQKAVAMEGVVVGDKSRWGWNRRNMIRSTRWISIEYLVYEAGPQTVLPFSEKRGLRANGADPWIRTHHVRRIQRICPWVSERGNQDRRMEVPATTELYLATRGIRSWGVRRITRERKRTYCSLDAAQAVRPFLGEHGEVKKRGGSGKEWMWFKTNQRSRSRP